MLALIFAAGLGTRLRPLTDTMPKALVPLAGKTLLEYQICKLKAAGITDIIVNVHHFPDMIIDYLRAHDNFGCNIMISDEREQLLDTGGGLLKAWSTFAADSQEPFLALNVDILSTIRIEDVLAQYQKYVQLPTAQRSNLQQRSGLLGLLVVSDRQTQRYLCFDDTNRLIGWTNIATGETKPASFANIKHQTSNIKHLAFSGMQLLSPAFLPLLKAYQAQSCDKFSVIDFYLHVVEHQAGSLYAFPHNAPMMDVGKIDHLAEAEAFAQTL